MQPKFSKLAFIPTTYKSFDNSELIIIEESTLHLISDLRLTFFAKRAKHRY
jgi:hypothetical protein